MNSSIRWLRLTVCAGLLTWPLLLPAQKVPVVEKTLPNGMRLLLVERHDDPMVAGGWVAHVGSANERPGITGIAHLFEHMMFKGTPTIGTKDFKKDLEIIAEQERIRAEMRQEEAKMRSAYRRGEIEDMLSPDARTPRYQELEKRFNELIAQQRQVLVKNEFDRIYTAEGGSGMNAFTTEDLTGYFITVPANKLELWMWMESERLMRPVFREFYAERDVVYEERRMRTESTPLGKFAETFDSMIWESHPYGWPVIGWPSDISAITKAQADEFYSLYYSPQNVALILVGDFQPDAATALAERYFGRIPRGKSDPPELVTLEVKQPAEKRMYAEAGPNPQVDIVWHTVPFGHRDSYPLNILSQLLSTRTGRLYKGLILGSKVATDVSAGPLHRKYAGLFNISGEASSGQKPEAVEEAIYAELDKLRDGEIPAEELQKVKNNFAASEYRRLVGNMSILMQLLFTDGLGDWREVNEAGPKHQAVTVEDVKRVLKTYFTRENRTVAIYNRKPGGEKTATETLNLSAEEAAMLKAFTAKVSEDTNTDRLRQALQQVSEMVSKATDPKQRQMLEAQQKVIQKRLESMK